MKILVSILMAFGLALFNPEGAIACLRYVAKLSPVQTFLLMAMFGSCIFIFWASFYEKILALAENWQKDKYAQNKKGLKKLLLKLARWVVRKRNYLEKHKNKKIVKKIYTWKHLGLYICGLTPGLFHPGLCAQKIFIQSQYGLWCIWLGGITRLAINVFAGLKLIEFLIKLIT